jgi:hypothetical protein
MLKTLLPWEVRSRSLLLLVVRCEREINDRS